LFISLFKALGASPTPINFGEVYSALQTGLVDGQENPLILIDTAKLYVVQKYCSMTNHIWVGLQASFNPAAWKRLPPDLQAMTYKHFSATALAERADWRQMDKTEIEKMTKGGLTFNKPDTKPSRRRCGRSGSIPTLRSRWATKPGTCWRNTPGRWPDRRGPQTMRHAGAGRDLHPLCWRRVALRLQQPNHRDRRTRHVPVPAARDDRGSGGGAPRRAHAAYHLRQLVRPQMGQLARHRRRAGGHR
jgi:hypothetical protein